MKLMYVVYVCIAIMIITLIHMVTMCPDWDRYDEHWRTPLNKKIHYKVLGPLSGLAVIVSFVCLLILEGVKL